MIVRWIWSVPPAMEMPGTDRKISAIVPSSGEPGPASMPCGPAISACTRAACRAMTLLASLPSEPSGPGGARRSGGGGTLGRPPRRPGQLHQPGDLLAHQRVARQAVRDRLDGDQIRSAGPLRVPLVRLAGRGPLRDRLPPGLPGRPGFLGRRRAGPGRGETALVREDRQRDRPAAALLPDQVVGRDPGLIQEHLVERGMPVHLPQRAHLDPRLAHRQHEAGDAAVLGHAGIGASQQQPEVRGRRSGRPDLLPRHQPPVGGRLGPGRQPGQVRARSWLAEQLAPGDLAGDGTPDETFPERIGAVLDEYRPG